MIVFYEMIMECALFIINLLCKLNLIIPKMIFAQLVHWKFKKLNLKNVNKFPNVVDMVKLKLLYK